MKKGNRFFTALLAFAVLLGAVPFTLAPPAAAANEGAVDQSTKSIDTNGDGNADISLNDFMQNYHRDGQNKTYTLVKNVKVSKTSKLITPGRENLVNSTFDGNGYTITLEDGVQLETTENQYLQFRTYGLIFGENSTIRDVVIRVEGQVFINSVYSGKPLNTVSVNFTIYAGLLASQLTNCTVQDCAVIATGSEKPASLEVRGKYFSNYVIVGSLVGKALKGTTISGCYSDMDVWTAFYDPGPRTIPVPRLHLGGIVGELSDTGSELSDCAYYGKQLRYYGRDPRELYPYIGSLAGVLNGSAGIRDSYVDTPTLYFYDIDESKTNVSIMMNQTVSMESLPVNKSRHGYGGWVYATGWDAYSNVYARAWRVIDTKDTGNTTAWYGGDADVPSAATAQKLGADTWVDVGDYVNLKWLVLGGAPKVAVDGTSPPTVAITPDPPPGNDWQFDVSLPVKGTMPTAQVPTSIIGAPTGESVSRVSVERAAATGADPGITYAGAVCQFLATLDGVSSVAGKEVAWSAAYADGKPAGTITDGRLEVPGDAGGKEITVSASVGGLTSNKVELEVKAGRLSFEGTGEKVYKGSKLPVNLTLYARDNPPEPQLKLNTPHHEGTKLEDNALTVSPDETNATLTLTASGENLEPVTHTVTVTQLSEQKTLARIYSDTSKEPLFPGQRVELSVTSPAAVTISDWEKVTWRIDGQSGSSTLSSTTGKSTTLTAQGNFSSMSVWVEYKQQNGIVYGNVFSYERGGAVGSSNTKVMQDADPPIAKPVKPGSGGGGTGAGMTYSLEFDSHRVDGEEAIYQYEFVADANGTSLTGSPISPATGTFTPGKDPLVFTANQATVDAKQVFLKLTALGNSYRENGSARIFKIPLTLWGPTVGPAGVKDDASEGKPASVAKKTGVIYKADTPQASPGPPPVVPTAMDLFKVVSLSPGKLAQGDVKVTNVRLKEIPYNARNSQYFIASGSGTAGTGNRTAMPTISPRSDGMIGEGGITITAGEEGSVIYYTFATDGAMPPDPDPTKVGDANPTKLYEGKIDYPLSAMRFTVKAVAVAGKKSISSVDMVQYTRADNLSAPETPGLKLGDSVFESDVTYPADSKIHFTHPNLEEGTVFFTIDGRLPTEGNGETYKSDAPLTLPDNRQTVTIQAFFKHNTSLKTSTVATFTVQIRQRIGGPVASRPSNTAVPYGASLQLSVSDAALGQLDPNYGTDLAFLQRVVYQDGTGGASGLYDLSGNRLNGFDMQDSGKENGRTIQLAATSDAPIDGMQYISCVADEDSFTMPELRYLLGEGDPAAEGNTYGYALRMVTRSTTSSSANATVYYTVRYRNPPEIHLEGKPAEKLKVRAVVMSPSVKFNDSEPADFLYPMRERAAAPTAFPTTASDAPAVVRPGEIIRLTSQTSDAKIFYTLDNSAPAVDDAGNPGPATRLYDESAGIVMDRNVLTFMTIRAVAWKDGFDTSEPAMFIYQLPANVQPVLATPGAGALVEGTQVTLASTTEGATIYYTTDGKPVEVGKSQIYSGPITVANSMTIRAVAEKEGMTSAETKFDFTLARKLGAPSASLASGAVVYKGTRIYLSGSGTVAYTVDGSDPTAILTGTVGKDAQVLYGNSVVIDADFGKSVTVRAFCYRSGNTPSETASFTYTVCEEGDYLMAVPESGGTITPGTDITLTTSLTGGKIFYSVGSSSPELRNQYDSSEDYDDYEDYDDWYSSYPYRWTANTGTKEGGTVTASGEPGSTFIIRATAVADGSQGGTTKVFTYKFAERTPAPTASIPSGAITLNGAAVKLTVQEGSIFYTTDGSDPTTSSALYTGPIAVSGSMVLKTIAVVEGKEPSEIVQYVYTHAGQTAAPVMSVPGGEIEQGTRVELSTQTPGAVIYYTTDGTEPTAQSMAYTSPITIMRPITLKAKAMLEGLHESVVNSATYTVFEPKKPDPGEEADKPQRVETDRLTTRRTYSDDTAGPSFTEVVLVDPQYQAVLSSPAGIAPPDATLIVRAVEPTAKERQAVSAQTGYAIASAYDVSVERGGEAVVLSGTTELGLPIPPEYQNGVVTICRLGDDGSIEPLDTRRSGGVAYAMEGRSARYAIAVPDSSAAGSGVSPLPWVAGGGALAIAGVVALALYFRKKSGRPAG